MTKKKGEACGELDGQIFPEARFSSRKSSVAFRSSGERGYTFLIFGVKVSSRFISWSQGLDGGTWSVASFENTEANKEYFEGRVGLGLVFSAIAVSSVAVVSLAMIGDPAGIKRDPHRMIR